MSFLKWFFVFVGDQCFDNIPSRFTIRKKDRLPVVIVAYFIMILSLIFLFIGKNGLNYYCALVLIISSALFLYGCRFSFLYYFIAYIRFYNKDSSINDKIIFEHCVIYSYPTDVTKTISKYFKIVEMKGSIFTLKFYLGARSKRRRKETNFKTIILKITPNKIYFDGKKIFENKLFDMSDLEKILIEEAKQFDQDVIVE